MCLGAIYWARPARIFYASTAADAAEAGFDDAFIYDEIQIPADERRIPMAELQRAESIVIFHEWLAKSNKTPY
jgi:tRNA(Arg) A34 adenosine deaminase TadA